METSDTARPGLEAGPVKSALPATQASAATGHRASHGSLPGLGDGQTMSAIAPGGAGDAESTGSLVFDADAFDAEILHAGHPAGDTPVYTWNYSFEDDSVAYSFQVTTSTTATNGAYKDLSISGTVGGQAITGLDPGAFGLADDVEGIGPAYFDGLDSDGLGFTADGNTYNPFATGGGSLYVETATSDAPATNIVFSTDAVCYLRGTHILTPTGETRVETLKIGDLVVTRFGGIRPIKWIGRQTFERDAIAGDRETLSVRIRAGALGPQQPAADLYVSPGHSMLIDGHLVLAKTLVNGITITQELPAGIKGDLDYYNPDLGTHDCVIAEGAFAETFADGPGLRSRFHNAASYADLYPDAMPATQLRLCAPRPERGETLAALVRPIMERASHGIVPGPLRGAIDLIALPDRIDVWAQDTAHPLLPVTLEILLGDRVIGTSVALDHRADLEAAGVGNGRASLSFTCPVAITPEAVKSLRVRRASDGAELAMTEACRASLSVSIGLRKAA
jgi:hypothetical protein